MRGPSRRVGRAALAASIALTLQGATFVAVPPIPATAATVTQTVSAAADTYVDASTPTTALGTRVDITTDASPTRYAFLRFDLSGISGTITAATLRLHTQDTTSGPSPAGGTVRRISSSTWSEATTTYNNRPSTSGTTIGSFGAVARNSWNELNALSGVTAGAVVNLSIVSTNGDGAYYDSRETGANGPQLVLTIETSPSSTVSLVPTGDTYVENGTASAVNFGTAATIVVDDSPVRHALLRFDLRSVTTVGSAKLRLHVTNNANGASPFGGTVSRVTGTWTETTTTYDSRPTLGASVVAFGAVAQNTWAEVDVTSAAVAGAFLDLAITSTNTDGAYYDARETGATAPQLVVSTTAPPPPPSGIVIAAVGDIACAPASSVTSTSCRQLSVSNLIHNDPSVQHFLALGDLQYPNGELANFQASYEPSFGRFLAKTKPAPGNHEYQTADAAGYFAYFGALAGDPSKGYYSFDVGETWHIVALNSNSNCVAISCAAGSAQEQWLRGDLLASTRPCTIAYWHHPRWTSSSRGDNTSTDPLWRAVADDGAELVLTGHEHVYERFAPVDATGAAAANGVRSMVVGTGGNSLGTFGTTHANSLVRLRAFGVLRLILSLNSYSWQMVNESGTVLDSGTGTCR